MANSLQEQLLKAGLVSEDQLEKAKQPPKKARRRKGGDNRHRSQANGQRSTAADAKNGHAKTGAKGGKQSVAQPLPPPPTLPPIEELNRQIRVLLDANRQNDDAGEVPFYFQRDGRIKKLFVTEEQRQKLVAGEFAVAGYRRRHHVIPIEVADKILALREEIFVFRTDPDTPSSDDAYADHEVPDDLVW